MKPLNTPRAILYGLAMIALAIASTPYSSKIITPTFAGNEIYKIAICNTSGFQCVDIRKSLFPIKNIDN